MKRDLTPERPPVLGVAVGLLVWGVIESNDRGFNVVAASPEAAGLLVLGVWVTLEVLNFRRRDSDDRKE